jgi:hypothetical protein
MYLYLFESHANFQKFSTVQSLPRLQMLLLAQIENHGFNC